MTEVIDLGFCPRCKEDLERMMTRVKCGIKWCHLCSFDLEESPAEKGSWIRWAKEYDKEMPRRGR